MRVVGIGSTVVAAVIALILLIVLIMSIPDIKRYFKIRSM